MRIDIIKRSTTAVSECNNACCLVLSKLSSFLFLFDYKICLPIELWTFCFNTLHRIIQLECTCNRDMVFDICERGLGWCVVGCFLVRVYAFHFNVFLLLSFGFFCLHNILVNRSASQTVNTEHHTKTKPYHPHATAM